MLSTKSSIFATNSRQILTPIVQNHLLINKENIQLSARDIFISLLSKPNDPHSIHPCKPCGLLFPICLASSNQSSQPWHFRAPAVYRDLVKTQSSGQEGKPHVPAPAPSERALLPFEALASAASCSPKHKLGKHGIAADRKRGDVR